jgi:aspartyl aminopeptidase
MDPILANTPAGVNGEKGDFRQAQSSTEQFAVPPGETGMDTIYFGFPLVSMHTHFELTHKVELYSAYIAYKFFLQDELKKK